MIKKITRFFKFKFLLAAILFFLMGNAIWAQQKTIGEYVIFGGKPAAGQTAPSSPGYGVILGASSNITGGDIGSYQFIQSTGDLNAFGNVNSGGTIQLYNINIVNGKITAANSQVLNTTILSVGNNASLGGNIDVNGNIIIGSGIVSGRVTHPLGTTYSGPVPSGGEVTGAPALPILPEMPAITAFPSYGTTNITNSTSITPGAYKDVNLKKNSTLTFSGPGIYIFKSFKTNGPNSNIIFDFLNTATGNFKIYVYEDVIINKTNTDLVNGGSANRIYTETHGNGSADPDDNTAAFNMTNGSNGNGNSASWLGTVWAPYAAIKLGSPTGPSSLFTGALWSGTQVNLQGGVTVNFAPFPLCVPPDISAGPDKPLDFENPTILTAISSTQGINYSWQALEGGIITTPLNAPSITVTAAGTYVVTASASAGCSSTDTVIVTGKVNDIIGSELDAVLQTYNAGGTQSPFFEFQNDKIFIDVIAKQGEYANVKSALSGAPWNMSNFLGEDASSFIITGLFPINKLDLLRNDPYLAPKIVYVRPYYRAFNNFIADSTGKITQGDTSVRAYLVRQGYDLSGNGIKIGVLSNSFNTSTVTTSPLINSNYEQDMGNKELPGPGNSSDPVPVTVLKESPFVRPDEGRAMLQIIHDLAPKAQLYFRTGVETSSDFAAGIDQLKQEGCNIIVDDITYITEPFLKDGAVANAVKNVTDAGVTYITSSGNFARKSYENNFNPMPAPGNLTGKAHDFGSNDAFLDITLIPGQQYTMVLQWLDDIYSQGETAGTRNDLDFYLTPNTDGTALFGFNRNNLNGDPIEFMPFTYSGPAATHLLVLNNTLTSNPARFKIVIFQGDITFNEYTTGGSTIIGQSNAASAITVGAARFDKISPPYPGPLSLESFSSTGDGNSLVVVNNIAINRNKPDLVGPDGVTTTVNMGPDYNSPNDPDLNYSNFFGTSAAAPHVAGVAALIMEGKKKFLNQTVSPAAMKALLLSTATDMNTPGFDFATGAGFVNADSAMRTFAAPDPTLIRLVVPQYVTPGPAPFELTVTGENLSSTSIVKLGETELSTTYQNSELLTAEVPAFIGDPVITVYTPSLTNAGDGGTSEGLKFTGVPKRNIVITADNKSTKYAQAFPAFTATITVDGIPLDSLPKQPGQTEQDVLQLFGLDLLSFNLPTGVAVGSNIGTYSITPARVFDPANPDDVRLQEIYAYTFKAGDLTIEKLPVTVTALPITVTYGEKLPDAAFTYALTNAADTTGIQDLDAVLATLQASHQGQIAKDAQGNDILGLVNGQAVMIVNGQAVPIVNGQAVTIVNGQAVTIVNGQAVPIVNGQAITIVNGQAQVNEIDLSASDINNLNFQVSTQSLQNARTISNQELVNGTYVSSATQVVDITQESILDFNVNSAQTNMLTSLSNVNGRGVVDMESYTNGQAITIVNGQAVTIVNGQAVTIVNGQAVTIVNGQAVTIVNGQAVPIVNSQNRDAVILNENEIGLGINQLKSLNMITGLDVGNQYLIPGSVVNNNFEVTHIAGVVTILPAAVTVTPNPGQEKVYGDDDPAFTFTNNAGLKAADFTGALGRVEGSDVNSYAYTLGNLSAGDNYTLSLSTTAPVASFAITARPVTITPSPNQSKVYGDNDPVFTYTSSEPLQTGDNFSGALGRSAGDNVATYAYTLGTLSAGANYSLTLGGTNTFTINKRAINILPNAGQNKVYGSSDPSFTYTASESLISGNSFNGTLSRAPDNTIGNYAFTLGSLSAGNNYTLNLTGAISFEIKKAPLQVVAGIQAIYKGDNLPSASSTVTITGLQYNDNATPNYTTSPVYSKSTSPAGVYTIIPSLASFANAGNYAITYTNGTLYVNPKGPGAKKLISKLDCVVEVINPLPGQFQYIAHFTCNNNNSTPVYVPIGPDNNLSSQGGSFDGSAQPALFPPGMTGFEVPFDGNKLTWEISTYESNHKSAVASDASSSSGRCNYVTTGSSGGTLVATETGEAQINKSMAYPNPAHTNVTIYIPDQKIGNHEIMLLDMNGRTFPAKINRHISENAVELDLSHLPMGLYLIRIKLESGLFKTIRIVKG
ncbi:MAG: S8 family serine peptidase [Terrimonas sp.]|nr:S8 family serine peptidase [Terrimonas sp.]